MCSAVAVSTFFSINSGFPSVGFWNVLYLETKIPKVCYYSSRSSWEPIIKNFLLSSVNCFPANGRISHSLIGNISSPTRKNGTVGSNPSKVSGGGILKRFYSNFLPILEFNRTLQSLLLPYFPMSIVVKL